MRILYPSTVLFRYDYDMEYIVKKIDFMCHTGYDCLHEIGATVEDIGKMLDTYDVTHAVLSPMGDGLIHRFGEENRRLSEICADNDRFSFFCTANPWFGSDAEKELETCFGELGAKGVAFDTVRQGCYIDAPMIEPLIEIAGKYGKPVYFLTGTPIYGLPLSLANLALKYPEITFIMGSMGASDYWGDVIPSMRMAKNILIETSLNSNVPAVFPGFVAEFGFDRILFGTNYPYGNYRLETEKFTPCGFTDEQYERIFYLNAAKLLGLEVNDAD